VEKGKTGIRNAGRDEGKEKKNGEGCALSPFLIPYASIFIKYFYRDTFTMPRNVMYITTVWTRYPHIPLCSLNTDWNGTRNMQERSSRPWDLCIATF